MSTTKSRGPGINVRLRRWETALAMVFLVDLVEDRLLFRAEHLPAWSKVMIKMAVVVGLLGILLNFLNKRVDVGLMSAHSVSGRSILPRLVTHSIVFGALFLGFYWLKIGKLPWA